MRYFGPSSVPAFVAIDAHESENPGMGWVWNVFSEKFGLLGVNDVIKHTNGLTLSGI